MPETYECEPAVGACNATEAERKTDADHALVHHCRMGGTIKHSEHVCVCGYEWAVLAGD